MLQLYIGGGARPWEVFADTALHCDRASHVALRAAALSFVAIFVTLAPLALLLQQAVWHVEARRIVLAPSAAMRHVILTSRASQARAWVAPFLYLYLLILRTPWLFPVWFMVSVGPSRRRPVLLLAWPAVIAECYGVDVVFYYALWVLGLVWAYGLFVPRTPLSALAWCLHVWEGWLLYKSSRP